MIRVAIIAPEETRLHLAGLLEASGRFELVAAPLSGEGGRANGMHNGKAARRGLWNESDRAPEVVVVDADSLGADLVGIVEYSLPSTTALLLADHLTPLQLRRALRAGFRGILARNCTVEELAAAVNAASLGLHVFADVYASAALPASPERIPGARGEALDEPLTRRESEVLALLAGGATNRQIAARLGVSLHTVKFHVSSILAKLGAESRTEAVAAGIRRGFVLI